MRRYFYCRSGGVIVSVVATKLWQFHIRNSSPSEPVAYFSEYTATDVSPPQKSWKYEVFYILSFDMRPVIVQS